MARANSKGTPPPLTSLHRSHWQPRRMTNIEHMHGTFPNGKQNAEWVMRLLANDLAQINAFRRNRAALRHLRQCSQRLFQLGVIMDGLLFSEVATTPGKNHFHVMQCRRLDHDAVFHWKSRRPCFSSKAARASSSFIPFPSSIPSSARRNAATISIRSIIPAISR